jgi:uncharacterized protein DUF4157/lysine-specific metallo-endopeptidase family protein
MNGRFQVQKAPTPQHEAHPFRPSPVRILQRKCACGGTTGPSGECEACHRKRLERVADNSRIQPEACVAPALVHDVLRSPGQPLDPATRAFAEPRFGRDFSQVRVHTGEPAGESARAVNALAYTVGKDVVFAAGLYRPHTADGRSLISHELAHVVQQSGTHRRDGDITMGEVNSLAEREADKASREHEMGDPVRVMPSATPPSLQRKWDWKRAGRGALIGGLIGGGLGLIGGPLGGLIGLGAGALIGGLIGGLTGSDKQDSKAQKPDAIPPAPGCTPANDGMLAKGLQEGLTMLRTATSALSGLTKAPKGGPAERAATALQRYFKSDDSRIANHVSQRLNEIHGFMSALTQKRATPPAATQPGAPPAVAPTECHTKENDDSCGQGAVAYVPEFQPGAKSREGMVFCPRFFETATARNDQERGGVIIHEAAHSLITGEDIGDRGYADQRFFPDLTTEDALTNADSYRVFVLHVAGDSVPSVGHIFHDIVEDCGPDDEAKIGKAFGRIQRWLGVARRVVHDTRPAWRALDYWVKLRLKYLGGDAQSLVDAAAKAFDQVGGMLGMFVGARCHPKADATCPPGTATAVAQNTFPPEIQLCPTWLTEKDADRQAILMFAEMLGVAGVTNAPDRLNHAELARQLFMDLGQAPSLEKILAPFETPAKAGSAPNNPGSTGH